MPEPKPQPKKGKEKKKEKEKEKKRNMSWNQLELIKGELKQELIIGQTCWPNELTWCKIFLKMFCRDPVNSKIKQDIWA